MANMPIAEIVKFLKSNPIFAHLQAYIDEELAKERELYETSDASEYLRGRVAILKRLQQDLRK